MGEQTLWFIHRNRNRSTGFGYNQADTITSFFQCQCLCCLLSVDRFPNRRNGFVILGKNNLCFSRQVRIDGDGVFFTYCQCKIEQSHDTTCFGKRKFCFFQIAASCFFYSQRAKTACTVWVEQSSLVGISAKLSKTDCFCFGNSICHLSHCFRQRI